ncbi:MAG: Coq4 family protein [Synechococcus sp.]
MARFQELLQTLQQLRRVIEVGRHQGGLDQVADLVDSFLDTPQMEACVARFRALPGGARLMEERFPPLQPDIEALRQLPAGSLGHGYAQLILSLGYDPEFFRPRQILSDAHWLTQRIATTHDLHHVIGGFGTAPEGESGVLAITACQTGFPAYVALLHAAQLSRFRLEPQRYAMLSAAISHGTAIGFEAAPLAAVRWEEGWERSIEDWRHELGIQRPADGRPYGAVGSAISS